MNYRDLLVAHREAGLPDPCPSCYNLYTEELLWAKDILPLRGGAWDAISRSRRGMKICQRCAKMEFLMDYIKIDEDQAIVVALQDWNEAIRIPAGTTHGVTIFPTGGIDEWSKYWKRRERISFYRDARS